MQVTAEYVEQISRSNCFSVGYKYTMVIISIIKRALAEDIPAEYRLKFLNQLDGMVNRGDAWLTAAVIAAIEPMCDGGNEMYREAAKLTGASQAARECSTPSRNSFPRSPFSIHR
jgi:hypothetical protein